MGFAEQGGKQATCNTYFNGQYSTYYLTPYFTDDMSEDFPAKKPKNEPGKYDSLTREELLVKLENIEHRKSCLESDIAEKNAKLAAVITAAEFSEEKLKEIFAQADIEKKQNGRGGRKANGNKKTTKPIEPWILEMEVEYTISGQRLKIFTQCSDSPTCMMECMVCQPIKKITITAEQMNRHLYGKLHVGQMKRFKYIPNEGTFVKNTPKNIKHTNYINLLA